MQRIALTLAPKAVPAPRPLVTNGYTLWEGKSRGNGQPIAVVITGVVNKSENPKTGPMAQVWVIPTGELPADAVRSGADEAVCNDCPFRAAVRKETGGKVACYVRADAAVQQVAKSYHADRYPRLDRKAARELLAGLRVRGGAYGNLSNAPFWVSALWANHAQRHTQYDHNWRKADPRFALVAMASVGTPEERREAKALGWRTFRVKQPDAPVLPGERECPAQDKFRGGTRKHVTCHDCGACHGTGGIPGKADIVIDDHGPTSRTTQAKRAAARS